MTDMIMKRATEEEILREKAIARDKFLHWQASCQRENKRLKAEKAELQVELEQTCNQLEDASAQLKHAIQSLATQGMDTEKIAEIMDMREQQVRAYL